MASSARLVTIKRSGGDGAHFPLSLSSCLFGRSIECDIRIQLPVVSKKHCKIEVNKQQAILYNFSSTNPAQVNGATIDEPVQLKHGDIITIIDRSFRYENGNHEDGSGSTGFPEKSLGQEPARRASRASFSDDSDGKGQDAKSSKTTASRRSSVHDKKFLGDSSASDGSKDSVTQDLSNTCSSGHVEQHSGRNLGESTSSDLFKKSRATGSSYRELKSSPAHSLSNSKKNESPFEKLYQSMKEELDIKSQKPSRRKSEPQPECAAEKEMWETKLLVSCKSRAKSSGSTPETAPSSPKVGKVWTENQNSAVRPLQTSTEALSSSFSLAETAKTKTPVRTSQQLEDFHVSSRRESVNLDESEGAKAVHKIVTPRKSGTRNQTPVKVEYAASPADTPENLFSKKRRSIPAKVEVLSAETQNRSSSIQHLAPGEKKTPKEAFSKPEKLATAAEQICSGLPGLSSVDISNFGDSINKSEGMSLKRRRVSFGGRLRPELFDENLPPNTPLKRGETPIKRKSLAPHTPAVLKKIIKERPQSPGKLESPGVTPPTANDERRRSGRILPASDGSKSLHQTDTPKKAGRKSGNLPAKRASISRSQHDILQMICSKRRSGASEANLIVAKSWADVVKLGAKQTQTKVVKHVPQKQTSKRQRRPNTPKKPTSNLHNQFSTGHANSPCTIVIGRAQIEKVSMPARPYKMLNNLMLNRKMDFNEDLSGLTEMFKTPVKENQQQMNDKASILSNSGNLPEKQFEVTNSENKPLPSTSEILGENVLSSTQNAAKEPSNKYFASPTLRRRSIKNGNTVQTPKNDHDIAHVEKKTPGSVTEPLKTVSSVNKLRRSRELRHTLVESMNENTEAGLAKGITGRHLRKTSLQGQEVDQQMQDSENTSQRFKEIIELKEVTEKTSAKRSCAREKKPTKDSMGSQMTTQTAACAEELFNQEKGTIETPEESMRMQNIPMSDGRRDAKEKVDLVYETKVKCWSRTPDKKAQPLEGPAGLKEPFETPSCREKPMGDDKTKVFCKSPQPTPENTKTSTKPWPSTSGRRVDMKEEHSALNFVDVSGGTRYTPKVQEHRGIKALKESENQMLDLTVTGSKKPEVMRVSRLSEDDGSGTKDLKESAAQALDPAISVTRSKRQRGACKKRSQSPEDLFGLQELFQTPGYEKDSVAGEKLTKMPHSSLPPEPTETSITSQRQPRTRLMKVHVKNELSGDRMLPQMSQEIMDISRVPEGEDKGISTRKQSVKRKLDTAVSVPSSKRQRVARAEKAQTLEGLPGFQELSQTPSSAVDSVTVDKTTKMLSKSPESMDTTSQTQPGRRLRRVGVTKEPIAQRKTTRVLRGTRNTPKEPVGDSKDVKEFKDSSQKQDPTVSLTGKRSQSRTLKEKTQPLEELPSIQEETATRYSCESPQPEEKESSVASERQLRIRLCKIDMKEEPTTQRKPPGRKTRNTPKEPVSDSGNVEELKESTKQKTDPAASVPASKRPRRVLREKAQPLELPGPKGPGHTEESANDERPTQIPCSSPQPEQVDSLPISPRRPRTRRGKVEVDEVPSLVRKAVPSSRQTSRSRKVPEIDDKDIQASKEPGKQKLETVTTVTASRRQLRGPKDGVQSLEVLGESKEITQMSEHTEKLRHDTNSLKSTLQQMPVPIKPLRTSRRVLRASKEDTTETTLEMVVDTRDSAESQSKSITFLPPKRKSARDGSIPRTRGLRSVTPKQEATDEKPAPKKQRTASSKRHVSPEPVKMKQLRIMSNKIEPVEEQISNITEEKEAQVENSAHPDQKTPLPSRYRKKTNEKQPRPEVGVSAEKVGIKKNEKTVKTSQETELQNTDDGAKKSTSRGKVSGKRICLRSGGQSEIPQPHAAEEKTSETGAEILVKTQKEKGISGDSDVRCLRSRKTGATLDSEPKPRVTRGAKKDTKVPKKDEDIVYTTKLRTRSHQNSKNV
ncbi:antigen KI-67-like protein [Cricetulus griseus]|nr:antigen KI-67-like protein [Cricetulus griseus]